MFDVLPRVRQSVNGVNFLERLWAYLTIKDLLERVARGELNSCTKSIIKEEATSTRKKRKVGSIPVDHTDDEDYDLEGSGEPLVLVCGLFCPPKIIFPTSTCCTYIMLDCEILFQS